MEIKNIESNIDEDCAWYIQLGIITLTPLFFVLTKQTFKMSRKCSFTLNISLLFRDWLVDQLKNWLVVRLTHLLKKCLTDYVLGSKTFPHVLLHATFRLGNTLSSFQNVYSVVPSRGSTTPLHFYTRPETPLLRPPLISGRDFLSRFLTSPFSRSSTPTDILDEAILKELTDVGWFAPSFLTSPKWCIWCGVYSALINV